MAGVPETLKGRSFTRVASWSSDELETLLDLADELKTERARRRELRVLPGRTIGLITGEIGMMHWHRGLTELTWRDYAPLAVPYVESAAVIVHADAPWRTLDDFLGACRSGRIRGSGGPNFSVWKFALAGLLDAAGCDPSRLDWSETLSGEQGLGKVLSGEADVAPITMTDARGPLRDHRARALATMEDIRHPQFPEVPTVQESIGVAWQVAHWRGIVAPPGLPDPIRDRFVEALRRVAADAAFRAEAAASAFTVRWRFGDEFARYMEQDDRQFGRVIALLPAETSCMH